MITPAHFDALAAVTGDYLVSIYLSTSPVGREQEDRLKFANALRKAELLLTTVYGLRADQARDYLAEAQQLSDDSTFWTRQTDGLAVFIRPGRVDKLHLPLAVTEDTVVDSTFYLSPLIPSLDDHREFYLLTLSQGSNRLFLINRTTVRQIDTTGVVPADMETALLLDDPNAQLQRAGGAAAGRAGVVFGHGAGKDTEQNYLKEYFDRVDNGIRTLLRNDFRPLLLAGVDALIPVYHAANGYPHLIENLHVSGNVDNCTPAELFDKAWSVVGPTFDRQRDRDYEIYGDNSARGETADDLETLVPAAINGRLAVLWLKANTKAYGKYRSRTNTIELTDDVKEGTELFDLAATNARLNGARVYVVPPNDLPSGDSDICGILRYAVKQPETGMN